MSNNLQGSPVWSTPGGSYAHTRALVQSIRPKDYALLGLNNGEVVANFVE